MQVVVAATRRTTYLTFVILNLLGSGLGSAFGFLGWLFGFGLGLPCFEYIIMPVDVAMVGGP